MRIVLTALFVASLCGGCATKIGDDCESSIDCSFSGNRICDKTMPSGYCTVRNCEPGTCPGEATCVRFRPDVPRLSSSWCMATCGSKGDCRDDNSTQNEYDCVYAEELGEGIARVIDANPNRRFCAGVPKNR